MHIKKYVANSIQEALRQVKKELGPDALILSVNNIKARTGPLALMSPARVEVTVAIDEAAPAYQYPAGTIHRGPAGTIRRDPADTIRRDSGPDGSSMPSLSPRGRVQGEGRSFSSSHNSSSPPLYKGDVEELDRSAGLRTVMFSQGHEESIGEGFVQSPRESVNKVNLHRSPDLDWDRSSDRGEMGSRQTDPSYSPRHLPDLPIEPWMKIQKVTQGAIHMAQSVRDVLKGSLRATGHGQKPVPGGSKELYGSKEPSRNSKPATRVTRSPVGVSSLCQFLKQIGLQEDIVEHISDVLSTEIPHSGAYTGLRLEELARDILQQLVKTSGPIFPCGPGRIESAAAMSSMDIGTDNGQRPKYVALVGPTGTGKTTTIAKLAADILLKRRKKIGLITIDTYRVGALEQLNTYAGIMNIPIKLASTFEQMRKAVLQYQDLDMIMIDTAGFSHHDREHLQLLNAFLAQVVNPEIHLVLSTNTDEKELIHISERFNLLHYGKLLFTKVDESSYPGTIFNHMVYTGKPISYITTGQKVPEDIEVATPAGIINMMFQKRQFYASPAFRAEKPEGRG